MTAAAELANSASVPSRRVVVIGGVAAGMSAATRLRRLDERAQITVLERGEHVSFANCGLPYFVGGVIPQREDLLLQTPESLAARFNLDVRVRTEALAIDRSARTVQLRTTSPDGTTTEAELPYDALVLAPGAQPFVPPIPGIERALSLRDVRDADALAAAVATGGVDGGPARSAVVLGAGFIGLEMAENLHHRGLAVTLVELAEHVLPPLDPEMAAPVAARLTGVGIDVRTATSISQLTEREAQLTDGTTVPADIVVAAVGVRPDTELARAAGLEVNERGGIVVDAQQRSSDPHIWAAGDAAVKTGAIDGAPTLVPLAQVANRHGRLVADSIMGRPVQALPTIATAIVGVLGLQVAMTGWSETRARAAGLDVVVIHNHPADHAGYYPGAKGMSLKLVAEAGSGRILGAQGLGESGVDKRIDIISTAIRAGLSATDLADLETTYAPSFGAAKDPVHMLGLIADNVLSGLTDTLQWHELDAAVAQGATVVDVRSAAEYQRGHIPGAVNISVDGLREHLDQLPEGPLVVSCQVGLRGHVAARVLSQLGRQVRNLDGGYRTWSAVNGTGVVGAEPGQSELG
ncbi:Coenzyme A disulfide reductase [Actinomyces bovis]|uniref:Coenzyme A disulfide reductase n=1 Tax=Actinomyces bovis TaxID=1658 RepID=A0ABY1VLM3_9ACTO|nr:FAD-dependent oxidoreductase [Actinomyces bovis]SPT52998.1 Coenzyme A disulfide reductase [Actinomyces bovis]VEG55235.1 Coenzyme A disulfide reductase [Actinomyces israelii]